MKDVKIVYNDDGTFTCVDGEIETAVKIKPENTKRRKRTASPRSVADEAAGRPAEGASFSSDKDN